MQIKSKYLLIQGMNEAFCRAQNSSKRQRKLYITPPECITKYILDNSQLYELNAQFARLQNILNINIKGLYLLKFLNAAVSSNSPLISSGYGFSFTSVNGFISRKLKSKSKENRGEKWLD